MLNYTKELPKVAGWYWVRHNALAIENVIRLRRPERLTEMEKFRLRLIADPTIPIGQSETAEVTIADCEFAGPIPRPGDSEDAPHPGSPLGGYSFAEWLRMLEDWARRQGVIDARQGSIATKPNGRAIHVHGGDYEILSSHWEEREGKEVRIIDDIRIRNGSICLED